MGNADEIITHLVRNSEVVESYLDVWGNERRIHPGTRQALEPALGRERRPAAFQRKLAHLRKTEQVNYAGVAVLKRNVLELVFRDTKPKVGTPGTFAVYEALREKHGGGWESWPREFHSPASKETRRFISRN